MIATQEGSKKQTRLSTFFNTQEGQQKPEAADPALLRDTRGRKRQSLQLAKKEAFAKEEGRSYLEALREKEKADILVMHALQGVGKANKSVARVSLQLKKGKNSKGAGRKPNPLPLTDTPVEEQLAVLSKQRKLDKLLKKELPWNKKEG